MEDSKLGYAIAVYGVPTGDPTTPQDPRERRSRSPVLAHANDAELTAEIFRRLLEKNFDEEVFKALQTVIKWKIELK